MSLTALVIGSALMGPIGMIIAIPLCAALKGIFVYYFENETGRQLVAYDGAVFKGTPYRDADGNPVAAYDALGDDTFIYESELIGNGLFERPYRLVALIYFWQILFTYAEHRQHSPGPTAIFCVEIQCTRGV